MAEETKKEEGAENLSEAPAEDAAAAGTAHADAAPDGESAPMADDDAGLDPVEALIAERDSLRTSSARTCRCREHAPPYRARDGNGPQIRPYRLFPGSCWRHRQSGARCRSRPQGRRGAERRSHRWSCYRHRDELAGIQTTMERHGIRRISRRGKFDYNFHQAMFEMPRPISPRNSGRGCPAWICSA